MKTILAAAALCLTTPAQAFDVESLYPICTPDVHPSTMRALVAAESSGNALAVVDAGPEGMPWSQRKTLVRSHKPQSHAAAVSLATSLIAQGHIVALGLAQVSSRNLRPLGLTVEQALDPCTNLRAGAQILSNFYRDAVGRFGTTEKALLAAISAYNTGNFENGFSNGYVSQVLKAGQMASPPRAAHQIADTKGLAPVPVQPATRPKLLSEKVAVVATRY